MKKDIILAGVGGQGILSIATVIGYIAVKDGMFLKQSEVHGMSQRGGEVQSNLRISDKEIASDLIPEGKADMIISVEPMESLRYLPWLAPEGWLITNTNPFVNINNYPDLDKIIFLIKQQPRNVAFNADEIAKEIGSVRYANIVILGAASVFFEDIMSLEKFEDALHFIFEKKGENIVELNMKALMVGREIALEKVNKV